MFEIQKKIKFQKIAQYIVDKGSELTVAKISNALGIDKYDDIWGWAVEMNYLLIGNQRYCSLTGAFKINESDYYDYLKEKLYNFFRNGHKDGDRFGIEITAHTDSNIVGRWTRPDLVAFRLRNFPYVPSGDFDVITFEVKTDKNIDVLAVYEALAHRSAASRSYVVFPKIEENDMIKRVYEEASKNGIGIILIENFDQLNPLSLKIEAGQVNLDRQKCSDFLRAVMSANQLASLSGIRGV
jgi:hypothetical protein